LQAGSLPGSSQGKLTSAHPQQIAYHPIKRTFGESPHTTKLYDRTNDAISLDEIERILVWLDGHSSRNIEK